MQDCKQELLSLLTEDVRIMNFPQSNIGTDLLSTLHGYHVCHQRLAGASLLVFANKQDLQGSMTDTEIRDVRSIAACSDPLSMSSYRFPLSTGA